MSDSAGFGMVPRYLRGTMTAYEIALYVALSWRADENGISWAGQSTLAQDAGMSRSTVQRALNGLEAKGLVRSQPWANAKGRTSNVYALRVWADPTLSEGTVKRQDGHPMKARSAPDQAKPTADMPSQGTTGAQIQSEEAPSQGTTADEQVGVRPTDANPRVSQTQRKKNQKNENQVTTTSTSPEATLKERMDEVRRVGGPVTQFLPEVAESLGWAPSMADLIRAEKQWGWATGGWRSIEIARDYVMTCRKKQWTPNVDGWWRAMDYENTDRERRTRGRAYAPNGVPL